jgi:serine protease Do
MNHRVIKPFAWLAIFIMLVSLACTLGSSPTPTVAPTKESVEPVATKETAPTKEAEPTKAAAPTADNSGAVTSREDIQNAVIRVVSQGAFTDPDPSVGTYEGIGSGSGFIVDPSGIAVTNNHVVTGAALIKVYFADNKDKAFNAKVLGVSECSDLAVIKIEGGPFPYLKWNSKAPKVGTEVWSAGYPLGDPEFSLHKGVISKAHANPSTSWASVESVLEHDATINPGNSGGPLVDDQGQVVGINYAASTSATNQFFAIAKAEADPVLAELTKGNNDTFIGVNGTAVTNSDGSLTGIWVSSVASGSPADKAGLKGGDLIMEMEGVTLARDATMKDYCDILRTHKLTDTLTVKVLRFSAGQLLEGQINGRELAVTGTFDVGTDTGSDTGTTDTGDNGGYFRQTFDGDLSDWKWFLNKGEESDFDVHADSNNRLAFELTGQDIYAYAYYDKYTYSNVRVETVAENLGANTNNVSLFCRYTGTEWYEFNVSSGGLYWIYHYSDANGYEELASGGSNYVNQGKDSNLYTIICKGDTLTLGVNGYEVKTVHDNSISEGEIGMSVSSFDVLPVKVAFDYVDITEP